MKNLKKLMTATLAAVALQFSVGAYAAAAGDAQAEVKVEDAVVGAVISGSVKLHGFFHSTPMPLPAGKWEVIKQVEFKHNWKTGDLPFVMLSLKNQDSDAQIRWILVKVNVETGPKAFIYGECSPKVRGYESNQLITNDFGTAPRASFYKRCGRVFVEDSQVMATRIKDEGVFQNVADFGLYEKEIPSYNNRAIIQGLKDGTFDEFGFGILQHPEVMSPKMIYLTMVAERDGGRLTRWVMLINPPKDLSLDQPGANEALTDFVQKTGDELEKFLEGGKATLPSSIAWPASNSAAQVALTLSANAIAAANLAAANTGDMLDGSGVVQSGPMQRALPLPPGQWKIIDNYEAALPINNKGGAVRMSSFTFLNMDKTSPIILGTIFLPTERAMLPTKGNTFCERPAVVLERYGTSSNSSTYACTAISQGLSGSLKTFTQVTESNWAFIQKQYKVLSEHSEDLPDIPYHSVNINAFQNDGNMVMANFITKGDKLLETSSEESKYWISVGQAFVNWVMNKPASIAPSSYLP
jgi:hypothetical protein